MKYIIKNDLNILITIVTAFYDIDRANWISHSRSTEEYFRCFKLLCQLKNNIIVFTQNKYKIIFNQIQLEIKKNLYIFYDEDIINDSIYMDKIIQVQNNINYIKGIKNSNCPEYWNAQYVLINFLKSQFCINAIEKIKNIDDTVAWVDFGYVKNESKIPVSKTWIYDFDDKIQIWFIRDIPKKIRLTKIIKTNTVYVQGCHIVAKKDKWVIMNKLMKEQMEYLLKNNLIDDDQTIILLAYLNKPQDFKIHREYIHPKDLDWFYIFQYYNLNCDENRKIEMMNRLNGTKTLKFNGKRLTLDLFNKLKKYIKKNFIFKFS